MTNTIHRQEEEKMGIIIMELGGKKHAELFYPSFSGVAQSFNYYPVSYMKREEGVVFTALGLGKTIVDGEKSLRFSPKYPKILPQYYSVKSTINNSQNKFYALDMNKGQNPLKKGEAKNLKKFDISIAEQDGELQHIASVVTRDDTVRDSLNYKGIRILTFSNIIKYNIFPLNDIITDLMKDGEKALGCPVEIEFAVNINKNNSDEFCLLQIKPMVIGNKDEKINIEKNKKENNYICYSNQVLGNGKTDNIYHIMYVNPDTFKRENTQDIAKEIESLNKKLGSKNPYLLIGPGRWGTADPWLGIPVEWNQISNVKSIVEIGIEELNPDPSFGSHFFQNIANLRIGYFTINKKYYKKYIDWDWIKSHDNMYSEKFVNVISLKKPLFIKIDGINSEGIILANEEYKDIEMNEEESSGI